MYFRRELKFSKSIAVAIPALVAGLVLSVPAHSGQNLGRQSQAGNENCAGCALAAKDALNSILSKTASLNLQRLVGDVQKTSSTPNPAETSRVEYSKLEQPQSSEPFHLWSPGQELPLAFKRPWTFAQTQFDPSFVTPYYNSGALIQHATAPWNLFVPPEIGQRNFDFARTGSLFPTGS